MREAYTYNDRNALTREGPDANKDNIPDSLSSTKIDYTYDANGAQMLKDTSTTDTTYAWDLRGRLTSMSDDAVTSTFGCDASGQRVSQKKGNDPQRTFVQDKNNLTGYPQTLEEWVGSTLDRSYLVAMRVEGQLGGDGLRMFVRDSRGSNRALLDELGRVAERYDYQAFGEKVSFVTLNPATGAVVADLASEAEAGTTHLHAGDGEYDALTSWYYNDARYRDRFRFTKIDPRGEIIGDTQNANLYGYVFQNPMMGRDPSGQLLDYISLLSTSMQQMTARAPNAAQAQRGLSLSRSLNEAYRIFNGFQNAFDTVSSIAEWANLAGLAGPEAAIFKLLGSRLSAFGSTLANKVQVSLPAMEVSVPRSLVKKLQKRMGVLWGTDVAQSLFGAAIAGMVTKMAGWETTDVSVGYHGFDAVMKITSGANPLFGIVEAKGGSSTLATTKDGKQMYPKWIGSRIDSVTRNNESPDASDLQRVRNTGFLALAVVKVDLTGNSPRIWLKAQTRDGMAQSRAWGVPFE